MVHKVFPEENQMKPKFSLAISIKWLVSITVFFGLFDAPSGLPVPHEQVKQFMYSSVSIEKIRLKDDINKVNPTPLGSGFLTRKQDTSGFAVTNYHVVDLVDSNELLLVGANYGQGKIYVVAKVFRKNKAKDIAILNLTDKYFARADIDVSNFKLNQKWVQPSLFAKPDEIQEGDGILMIGYPLGLGIDTGANKPLVRVGAVAQSVSSEGFFLMDAIASHGNSGSPVFSTSTNKLLGMIVAFPPEQLDLFDDNHKLVARLPYNSGLAICISAGEILSMLPY